MSLRLDDLDPQQDSGLPDDLTEPANMDPSDRLDEIAGILARGVLRLHGRVLPEHSTTADHLDRPPIGLELSVPSRPDGVAG
jgi:hypothetical protein